MPPSVVLTFKAGTEQAKHAKQRGRDRRQSTPIWSQEQSCETDDMPVLKGRIKKSPDGRLVLHCQHASA